MAERFAARLINGEFDDPALFVGFRHERRAMLFDLGRLEALSVREILKVSDVFVSHTHIDHFIGFDHLLRCSLNREQPLRLFGPPGFLDNVRGKLSGYTWNLVQDYPLALAVHEVDAETVRRAELKAPHGFRIEGEAAWPFTGTLLEEPDLRVRAAILDHKVPCLGFSLEESTRLNVNRDALDALGFESGPWLDDLKRRIRDGASGTARLRVPTKAGETRELTVQEAREALILESKGQKITYVVDSQYNQGNVSRILDLARDADLFFCEASFSAVHEQLARDRFHLTAAQAGELARRARVKAFVPFHFSRRYESDPGRIKDEALEAFGAPRSEAHRLV